MKEKTTDIEERMTLYLLESGFDREVALDILNEFGEYIWKHAQNDANSFRQAKFKTLSTPIATKTPYKKIILENPK